MVQLCLCFFDIYKPTDKNLTIIDECACPHQTWILECSVIALSEERSLTWTGSAFDCKQSNNEILLLPNDDMSRPRTCNNGSIVAHSFRFESNTDINTFTYTSQLNVKINSNIAGKNITCLFDENNTSSLVSSITVSQKGK